jgi:hypothetical protein
MAMSLEVVCSLENTMVIVKSKTTIANITSISRIALNCLDICDGGGDTDVHKGLEKN